MRIEFFHKVKNIVYREENLLYYQFWKRYCSTLSTFSQTTNFKLFQTEPVCRQAVNNFKFDENGRKFSKWVENIVGKGEIAF